MSKTFLIKQKYILGLGNWLGSLALNGRASRMRTRFISFLEDALSKYEKERKAMLDAICEKDEKGNPKTIEENGGAHYIIPDDKKAKFDKDLIAMGEEMIPLSGSDAIPAFSMVCDIILNFNGEIPGELAFAYDKWCETAEAYLNGPAKVAPVEKKEVKAKTPKK